MTKIKICGITNEADAVKAAGLGVDLLGFVFYGKSKRYVAPAMVKRIVEKLPPFIGRVGVFVDEDRSEVLTIAKEASLDILQFHGNETPDYCASFKGDRKVIKAFRLSRAEDLTAVNGYDTDLYLFDTYKADTLGGTGEIFDWGIIKGVRFSRPVLISGGLTPKNVAKAIKETAPYGVDVSSGVEASPGKKDGRLMEEFVHNVRKAEDVTG